VLIAIAVLVSLGTLGCGVHLHSPANQKLAERAQTEFQDAKITETMNEERSRLDELLKQELAAVRRLTLAGRDAAVVQIVAAGDIAGSWTAWKDDIHRRLQLLLGPPDAVQPAHYGPLIGELAGAQFAFTSARDALTRDRRQYVAAPGPQDRPPLSACPAVPAAGTSSPPAPPTDPVLKAFWDDYATECQAYRTAYGRLLARGKTANNVGATEKSALGKFFADLRHAEEEIENARAEMLKARAVYQAQIKTLKEATAKGTSTAPADLDKLVGALEALRKAPIFGQQEAVSAQLDSVVALLDNVAKGTTTVTPVDQGNQKVVETIQALNQALQKTGEKPTPGALVLAAEHLRLELERASRRVRFYEARSNLLHQEGVAFVTELTLLRRTLTELDGGPSKGCPQTNALAHSYEVDYATKSTCRDMVVASLLLYADSWTVGRLPEEEIRYLLISLDHAAAIDSSEIALMQWQNLVAVPLGQLVTFHRSGITSEEIGQLLQVLGLAAIAARL
jgi:hypothetical protein